MTDDSFDVTGAKHDNRVLVRLKDNSDGTHSIAVSQMNSLVPGAYDYVGLTYTGSNLTTAVFKIGGASGTTIATLTMTYDGSDNLLTVTKA